MDTELKRVSETIAPIVEMFARLHSGQHFHSEELLTYVRARVPNIAPDSPSRILRDLRRQGVLDYRCVNRRQSLYSVTAV